MSLYNDFDLDVIAGGNGNANPNKITGLACDTVTSVTTSIIEGCTGNCVTTPCTQDDSCLCTRDSCDGICDK